MNTFPSSAIDHATGRTVKVCKSEHIERTAFPVTLQQFEPNGQWWGPYRVGNTSDAWYAINELENDNRISKLEATNLRSDADKAVEKLKHLHYGKWIEIQETR